ncbi:hypothetical protein MYP_363 [Sporocytophaga myxococcoides]|uniref:Uncharacterized protein n=1 Tax=Sporocytophaga myxococcoides TaxID=153721 RepID=A0A098L968_9BACT|nr:efflux RND transporter periplasmic adaptor subunit [Sporocytophaga myxococcoides]GAL83137.1 hypothetical protein MYP_363 [Sporocytophaga myxococcoides]
MVKNKRSIWIGITVLLCIASFLLGYLLFKPSAKLKSLLKPQESYSEYFVYKTDTAKFHELSDEIVLNGRISFDENNVVQIFPMVSGITQDINVNLGDPIMKGQSLVSIKSGDISELLTVYHASKANYELAQKNFKVAEDLYKADFNSKLQYLSAKKELEKSKNELQKNKENLAIFGTSEDSKIPLSIIKSPINGYLVEKNITNNMKVSKDGKNLFTISDLNKVWIWGNVFEDDISSVKVGLMVKISTEAFPNKEFSGTIDKVSHVLEATARVLRIRVVIDNSEKLLRPEMYAKLKVDVPSPQRFIALDPRAVIFDKDSYFVVQVINKNLVIKKVEIFRKSSHRTFIESGVDEGSIVVSEGSLLIYNHIMNHI